MSTLQRLQALLQKDFAIAPDALKPEARLADLGIDSLAMLEILFSIEDEFKITLPAEPARADELPQTLGAWVAYIDALVAGRSPGATGGEAAP